MYRHNIPKSCNFWRQKKGQVKCSGCHRILDLQLGHLLILSLAIQYPLAVWAQADFFDVSKVLFHFL